MFPKTELTGGDASDCETLGVTSAVDKVGETEGLETLVTGGKCGWSEATVAARESNTERSDGVVSADSLLLNALEGETGAGVILLWANTDSSRLLTLLVVVVVVTGVGAGVDVVVVVVVGVVVLGDDSPGSTLVGGEGWGGAANKGEDKGLATLVLERLLDLFGEVRSAEGEAASKMGTRMRSSALSVSLEAWACACAYWVRAAISVVVACCCKNGNPGGNICKGPGSSICRKRFKARGSAEGSIP